MKWPATRARRDRRTARLRGGLALAFVLVAAGIAAAHPLGNFTVNQFDRVEIDRGRAVVRHVVDMAEIPTLQEMTRIDADGDTHASATELATYASTVATELRGALSLEAGGVSLDLQPTASSAEFRDGAGGLKTLRIEATYEAALPSSAATGARVRFASKAFAERLGWREIVVAPTQGVAVFDSSAYGNSLSDELRAYPVDSLTAPLAERSADFTFSLGPAPAGSVALKLRDGRELVVTRDALADLIAVPSLTPLTALLGLLLAAGLGAMHAMSPGHGKTVVGAYLVGSRGTVKHAAFLGLTVTITHTAGVFALGLLTLFASEYVLPERLFPILGVVSGAIVVLMGGGLFVKRLRAALGVAELEHHHHDLEHGHSHGEGGEHSHLPPGADGSPVTWKSLLALGVSGGLLPCPSALVVLLSAVTLHRIGYGLLLVVAFSVGLAGALTAVGLAFVYAGKLLGRRRVPGIVTRVFPVLSALVITLVGVAICFAAVEQAGYDVATLVAGLLASAEDPSFKGVSALGVLGLGLVFGLKHATEADHVVAVSTIVSEHKNLARAALVGGLWGLGHTLSLVVVGSFVLALRISIPEAVASWLEFGVAIMIIALGAIALFRGLRNRSDVHVHQHAHGGAEHAHVHFHEPETAHAAPTPWHSHVVRQVGFKPLVVGAVHGLAGSAALTLLVLTQIPSAALGLLYLAVFGVGSIGGMLIMSGLVGLPFALTSARLGAMHHVLQIVAGAFSLAFGVWYAYESGAATGLLYIVK